MASNNRLETLVAGGNVHGAMERGNSGGGFVVDDIIKPTSVPLTYCFLGLMLRLAFTKRRLHRVKSCYQHLLEEEEGIAMDALFHGLEQSFQVLIIEIERIEKGQEDIKRAALPCVRDRMGSYRGFMVFLSGFRESLDYINNSEKNSVGDQRNKCCISMLAQDPETTRGIKLLVADFLGAPMGRSLHDLRNLENLLEQPGHIR
uniref:Uncharacterized protein n=1 Tax=Amphora coffeiformis TaxID=265554 RepID=A0A7S3P4Y5_9STRA